ncbi:hypothetical protein E2C01_083741 [Portunus trituberculatus]|uniref:Uncharacterized protein n=1 Tax=Portunus trituberculatus TaxID=210409 RepID=A0A5B7IVY8_PORTR|nr:hypothetical protein [Portunus trituberculatus]
MAYIHSIQSRPTLPCSLQPTTACHSSPQPANPQLVLGFVRNARQWVCRYAPLCHHGHFQDHKDAQPVAARAGGPSPCRTLPRNLIKGCGARKPTPGHRNRRPPSLHSPYTAPPRTTKPPTSPRAHTLMGTRDSTAPEDVSGKIRDVVTHRTPAARRSHEGYSQGITRGAATTTIATAGRAGRERLTYSQGIF